MITKMTKTNIIILTLPLSSKPTLQTLTQVLGLMMRWGMTILLFMRAKNPLKMMNIHKCLKLDI